MFLLIAYDVVHGDTLCLTGTHHHHLTRVMRVRVGERLRAALPDGRVLCAEIREITAQSVCAGILGEEPPTGISPCRITLCQAVLKGEKMDAVVQKATELGVHTLAPLFAQRSVPRWEGKQAVERAARWQRIADAAAEQCERSLPMQVLTPATFAATLAQAPAVKLLLHEREGVSLHALAAQHPGLAEVALFLGPEGGWTEGEVDALRAAGATPLHLGGRILRAETATLAAVTLVQYLWGDLG